MKLANVKIREKMGLLIGASVLQVVLRAQFHEEASKVAQFAISGQTEAAERAMGPASEYTKISSALTHVLTRWSAAV